MYTLECAITSLKAPSKCEKVLVLNFRTEAPRQNARQRWAYLSNRILKLTHGTVYNYLVYIYK